MNTNILFLLPACFLLSSCNCDEPVKNPSPIFNHLNNDVVMSKGFDFIAKRQIALDPFTGTIVKPCPKSSNEYNYEQDNDPCNSDVILPIKIQKIIEQTESQIPVQVTRNGKVIDDKAVALLTLNVLYKGSHCEISYSGGTKTAACTTGGWLNFCIANEKYRYTKNLPTAAKNAVNYCEAHYWK